MLDHIEALVKLVVVTRLSHKTDFQAIDKVVVARIFQFCGELDEPRDKALHGLLITGGGSPRQGDESCIAISTVGVNKTVVPIACCDQVHHLFLMARGVQQQELANVLLLDGIVVEHQVQNAHQGDNIPDRDDRLLVIVPLPAQANHRDARDEDGLPGAALVHFALREKENQHHQADDA